MHSKIAVFMPKDAYTKDFDFSDIGEDTYYECLSRQFGADYCTLLEVSLEKFSQLDWFDDFKVGDNEYEFSNDTLRDCRLKTLKSMVKEIDKMKASFDDIKMYDWGLFMYRMKNPNWLESLEVILLDADGYIDEACRINEMDAPSVKYAYVGMIDYHF